MLNNEQTNRVKYYLSNAGLEDKMLKNEFLDHICCLIEKHIDDGVSFDLSLEYAMKELPKNILKQTELSTLKLINMEIVFSKKTALYACIPFFLVSFIDGFSLSGLEVPKFVGFFFIYGSLFAMFTLFVVGWTKDFPRWSFPAIGFCLLISLYFMNASIPHLTGKTLLGWWAWIPFIATMLFAILIHPSLNPVKKVFQTLKKHPALILLMLFGFTPFAFLVFCDEIYATWMLPIVILNSVLLTAGLFIFLTSTNKKIRNLSIVLSFILSIAMSVTVSYVYWKVLV